MSVYFEKISRGYFIIVSFLKHSLEITNVKIGTREKQCTRFHIKQKRNGPENVIMI